MVLGMRYESPGGLPDPDARDKGSGDGGMFGRVAAYAWGADYHDVIPERLKALVAFIEAQVGRAVPNRWYTDTGPLLERELAQRAGLGWIGKNTCLIHPRQRVVFPAGGGPAGHRAGARPALRRRPLRDVHALHRRLPDGLHPARPHPGCDALHLVPDHRAERADPGRPAPADGRLGLRLRHLPAGLPVEPALRRPAGRAGSAPHARRCPPRTCGRS